LLLVLWCWGRICCCCAFSQTPYGDIAAAIGCIKVLGRTDFLAVDFTITSTFADDSGAALFPDAIPASVNGRYSSSREWSRIPTDDDSNDDDNE
jgi:hypothetical protein